MIILNRKAILMTILFVVISVIYYGIISVGNPIARQTIALPVTNKVVIIDAGHGKPDLGAEGTNGTTEQKLNLEIALKLQKLIEQSGGIVILTRSDENGIYDLNKEGIRSKKVSDMRNRKKIGNESSADIFVSIHLNKFPDGQYRGWQTFYQEGSNDSKVLAELIQKELNENIDYNNTRVPMKIYNVYLMNNIKIPSVIAECGFLSNSQEERLLAQDDYQNKLAWGIYLGIQEYFRK